MVGAHQGDCNPTLDVSTRLLVGLIPLGGGDGYPEKDSQLTGHQVETALLKDVWIRQE